MRPSRVIRSAVLVLVAVAASLAPPGPEPREPDQGGQIWLWPVEEPRLMHGFIRPPHPYGPGHRGIDVVGADADVRAPAAGVIAFVGMVAGRPVITIDHGDGLVTTLEPVLGEQAAGAAVHRGQAVGTVAAGGHTAPGAMHLGVRRNGEYINPMLLLGGVPRAVLLPCCQPLSAVTPGDAPADRRRSGEPR